MSQAPIPTGTADGFAPPVVTQFAVFLDNRVGKMRELTQIFDGQYLTLCALSVVDATSYAVCRLVTSHAALCRRLLQRHGFAFSEIDLLAVELRNEHALTDVCQFLTQVEINIDYVYPLWVQPRRHPVVVLYTDDNTFAAQILRRRLVTLFGENELGENATCSDPSSDPGIDLSFDSASGLPGDPPADPADFECPDEAARRQDEAIEKLFDELPELSDEDQVDEDDFGLDDPDDDSPPPPPPPTPPPSPSSPPSPPSRPMS